jgi:hypothetical protein
MTETLFAIQWLNPQTDLYETCQSLDSLGDEIAAIYFDKDQAVNELEGWLGSGENYRMIEVTLKEIV